MPDIVVIEDTGLGEVPNLAPTALASSDYLDKEGVLHARAEEIKIVSESGGLQSTVEGEVIGDKPVSFSTLPGSLKVIVGADYVSGT